MVDASAVAGAIVLAASSAVWIWRKGRPFAPGDVFRASRLSSGNRLFPTQVLITPTSVVQYTPQWIGRQEESIHMAHVASVKIDTGLLFSDVLIETSGGSAPDPLPRPPQGRRRPDESADRAAIRPTTTGGRRPTGPALSAGGDPADNAER